MLFMRTSTFASLTLQSSCALACDCSCVGLRSRPSRSRLEDLIGEVTQTIPHRAIGQAIDLVIHIARTPTGRHVS